MVECDHKATVQQQPYKVHNYSACLKAIVSHENDKMKAKMTNLCEI
jgi:hypothetical protein